MAQCLSLRGENPVVQAAGEELTASGMASRPPAYVLICTLGKYRLLLAGMSTLGKRSGTQLRRPQGGRRLQRSPPRRFGGDLI